MHRLLIPFIVVALVALIYWISTYNRLIALQNLIKRSFSGIDIQLKKRWDLIPQLVATVKAHTKQESELLTAIVNARKIAQSESSNSHERIKQEQFISENAPQIIAVAEQYPELKSDQQFLMLQRNLTEIESQIAASRRSYNASILSYNNLVQSFPSSFIAATHQHQSIDFFSCENSERNNVRI